MPSQFVAAWVSIYCIFDSKPDASILTDGEDGSDINCRIQICVE